MTSDCQVLMSAQWFPASADFQQPLMLRDVRRKHSRDSSYTGSAVLSLLEQTESDHHLMSAASSFISARHPFSSHTSRSQSLATGLVRPKLRPIVTLCDQSAQADNVHKKCQSAHQVHGHASLMQNLSDQRNLVAKSHEQSQQCSSVVPLCSADVSKNMQRSGSSC